MITSNTLTDSDMKVQRACFDVRKFIKLQDEDFNDDKNDKRQYIQQVYRSKYKSPTNS